MTLLECIGTKVLHVQICIGLAIGTGASSIGPEDMIGELKSAGLKICAKLPSK
jgi:hypothetical protein